MASAAEQMAANLNWGTFGKAKELQQRILFALGLLIVYRIGTYIPVPGIDAVALSQFVQDIQGGIGDVVNLFSGGAIGRMAIFALGILPYISASIIVQLMTAMVPQLEQLKKEGEQGQKKINQYTRYGTVFLSVFQAYGLARGLEVSNLATSPGFLTFQLPCIITLVGGTMFLMWLGEQITARGIGNGLSLIIFVGIIAELPVAISQFFSQGRAGFSLPRDYYRRDCDGYCGDGYHCDCRTSLAKNPYPIPASPSRYERLWRGKQQSAVEGQSLWRYSGDFCLCLVVDANQFQYVFWHPNLARG